MAKIDEAVAELADYALRTGLIGETERRWAINTILETLKLDSFSSPGGERRARPLAAILDDLLDDAYARGVLPENSVGYRDLLDTALMGRLTPRPAQVTAAFRERLEREGLQSQSMG